MARPPGVTHLLPFSSFLPFITSVFDEAEPDGNLFLVYGTGDLSTYNLPAHLRVQSIGMGPGDLELAIGAFQSSAVAIVHSMSTFSAQVLSATPPPTLRVWSGWGGEYYGSRFSPTAGLLGPATARLERVRRGGVRDRAARAWSSNYVDSLSRAAAKSTDVFSAPVPTDFAVFRRRFREFGGRYSQLNYASVEDTYATQPDRVTGSDILVGNSATPENNHLETLALLAALDIGDRRVVVPLSYGDAAYADDVERAGVELLGDRFTPIRGYLPLSDYTALISRCGVVIMGHRRQQALGNVARAVWQGAHVFMDRRSPILEYFRAVGLPAQTLEELRSGGVPTLARSRAAVDEARETASSLWGRDVVIDNIRTLLASR